MQWEMVLGLEVHTQLATKSKLFSAAATEYGAKPNHQACPVDLAYPGMLPVLNPEVYNMAVKWIGTHKRMFRRISSDIEKQTTIDIFKTRLSSISTFAVTQLHCEVP